MKKLCVLFLFFLLFSRFAHAADDGESTEKIKDLFEPTMKTVETTPGISQMQSAELKLEGIGIGSGKAYAVINGEIYKMGEEKEGLQVTQIKKKSVDIIQNGFKQTLELDPLYEIEGRKN